MRLRSWIVLVILLFPVQPGPRSAPANLLFHDRHWHTVEMGSFNWSGYAVPTAAGKVTDVQGNWTVPAVTCTTGNRYSAVWVGIDGVYSTSVEQLGTEQDCQGGRARYSAWYEMYPSPAVPVNLAVHAGDQMFAEVRYIGNHRFTLTLKNLTTGRRFSITRTGRLAERSSAEWVVEAPSSLWGVLPLANFGTAYLTHSQATIGGVTGSIGQFTHYAMTMSGVDDTVKAQPSGLTNGGAGFSVEWNSP